MKKVILWVDDMRDPSNWVSAVSPILTDGCDIVWVKSYNEFCDWILNNPMPAAVCFDHDLGDVKDGYDCAMFLVNWCLDLDINLPAFECHSSNPAGRDNIIGLLNFFKNNRK